MPPANVRRGAAHGIQIERERLDVYILSLKHAGGVAVPDAVDIRFPHRREPGMEPLRRFLERERADILRQIFPEQRQKLRAGLVRFRPEGADLPPGMNAGVRTAAACDLHFLSQRAGEQRFKLGLHRLGGVSLLLPAAVARAVVGKRQFVILHPVSPPLLRRSKYTTYTNIVHTLFFIFCFSVESADSIKFVYIFPGICSWNIHPLISPPVIIASYRASGVQPPNDLVPPP